MWDVIRSNWQVIVVIVSVTASIIQLWLSKNYARKEDVLGMEKRVMKLEMTVEHTLKTLPDEADIASLKLEISELRGELKEMRPKIEQVSHLSQMLLENELNGAKS